MPISAKAVADQRPQENTVIYDRNDSRRAYSYFTEPRFRGNALDEDRRNRRPRLPLSAVVAHCIRVGRSRRFRFSLSLKGA